MPLPDTLPELAKEFDAKSKQLKAIYDEAGDDLDMSKVTLLDGDSSAKVAALKTRNTELGDLKSRWEELKGLEESRKGVLEARQIMETPRANETQQPVIVHPTTEAKGTAPMTMGRLFLESESFKGMKRGMHSGPVSELDLTKMGHVVQDVITGGRKTLLDETGYVPQAVRTGLILPGLLRRPVVADLLPQGTTSSISIVYMEETTTTNAAAATSEGADKPESAIAFTERSSAVRKIATVLPVTDELIEDIPAMESYVEQRLRVFLQLAEEDNLLNGNGTPPNLRGLMNIVGIQTQAKGSDPVPSAIYKGITKISVNAFLDADGIIMHPNDWQDIRLLQTADGLYILGSPTDPGPDRLWGLPVVKTPAATENTALVGAFQTAAQMFRRNEVQFAISDQHSDFFTKNKLMLRVEERLALVVYRPTGLCTITGI